MKKKLMLNKKINRESQKLLRGILEIYLNIKIINFKSKFWKKGYLFMDVISISYQKKL